MKASLAIATIVTGALLAGGCATKKYVRTTTAPIQAKVDQVGEQTTQNTQQIQTTQTDLKKLDESTGAGISSAKEMAVTADNHAGQADRHAGEAMTKATQAHQKADNNAQALDGLRSGLRNAIANIDDYQVQTNATVPFGFDQYKLQDSAREELDKLAAAAKADKRFFIAVEGFTDNVGNKEYNEGLSRRRADAVVQYLVAKHDIPVYRIYTIGLGQAKPADEGNTRDARARNRRVEVKLYCADGLATTLTSDTTGGKAAQTK